MLRVASRGAARLGGAGLGTCRGLAKGPAKGAKSAVAAPAASRQLEQTVTGLNIRKDGSDPAIKANSEYPDWVFELCAAPPECRARRARIHHRATRL